MSQSFKYGNYHFATSKEDNMAKKIITLKLTETELEIITGLLEQEASGLEKMQNNVDKEFEDEINGIDKLLKKVDLASK